MDFLITTYKIILYQPLFNLLILMYLYAPGKDFGVAVILLTLLIKFLLYPITKKGILIQQKMAELQPKLKEIEAKYKQEPPKKTQAIFELYKKEKINPFSGFLPLLIQLPILIALYQVFWKGFNSDQISNLYSFVPEPTSFTPFFFGLVNLSQPNLVIAGLAGVSQFFQSKTALKKQSKTPKKEKQEFAKMFQKQMVYLAPFFTFFILLGLPSALGLYWVTASLFTIFEQKIIKAQK